jgi:hypothetical protein
MNVRKGRLAMGVAGLVLAVAPVAGVAATDAVDGHASAVAAEVDGVVAIAHTDANAGPQNGNSATANALELGDKPPSKEFGGTQEGNGSSKGALLDTGATDLGQIQITPWSADVDDRSAVAKAALARLRIADAVAVDVLQSESRASYDRSGNGTSSTGSSSSDGAVANVGGEDGLTIVVLHAQANSGDQEGTGSYLLAINGQPIGTSKDANGACLFEVPSLVLITCLTADGGTAGDREPSEFEAAVLRAVVGGDAGLTGRIVDANGNQGAAGSAGPEVLAASSETPRAETLPFTGGPGAAGIVGLLLLTIAAATYRLRRAM